MLSGGYLHYRRCSNSSCLDVFLVMLHCDGRGTFADTRFHAVRYISFNVQSRPKVRVLHVVAASSFCSNVLWATTCGFEKDHLSSHILWTCAIRFTQSIWSSLSQCVSWFMSGLLISWLLSVLALGYWQWVGVEVSELVKVLEPFGEQLALLPATSGRSLAPLIQSRAAIFLSTKESWLVNIIISRRIHHKTEVNDAVRCHNVIKKIACLRYRIIEGLLLAWDRGPLITVNRCWLRRRGCTQEPSLSKINCLLEIHLLLLLK